jgi:HD superfamily phosphohydrolase
MNHKFPLQSIEDLVISREIRDPVYNYIHLTNFENDVLDSWIFQRLDGLAQMPTAHLVYPSGKYSRKTHSLGAMHLMSKAILHILFLHSEKLRKKISPLLFGEPVVFKKDRDVGIDHLDQRIDNKWWNSKELDEIVQYSRLAALLHDIGHAPFSHTFEDTTKDLYEKKRIDKEFSHEEMSQKIIEEKENELKLGEFFKAKEINEILKKNGNAPDFLKSLIDGPCDCDKLDYLMRDSYHMGTPEYGKVDAERIIDGFRVVNLQICISSSALHAMMNSFRAIQSMYTTIYYHRASRAFDFMIADALSKIPEFITEITSSVDEFLKYDDHSVFCAIRERAQGTDSSAQLYKEASGILEKVRYRKKTYKHILEFPLSFPLVVKKEPQIDIQNVCKEIEEFCRESGAEDLNIRLDYRPAIRPVGIRLEDIINWLTSPIIHDTEDKRVKHLKEISEAYFRDLTRYSIIFRIFVDKKESKKHPQVVNKIKKMARKKLKSMDAKWKSFSA